MLTILLYFWWIPIVVITYTLYAWLSHKANVEPGWFYVFWTWICGCCGIWPIVAKYSQNIVRDAILFDFLMVLTFYGLFAIIGVEHFGVKHWCGAILAIAGILIMKV